MWKRMKEDAATVILVAPALWVFAQAFHWAARTLSDLVYR